MFGVGVSCNWIWWALLVIGCCVGVENVLANGFRFGEELIGGEGRRCCWCRVVVGRAVCWTQFWTGEGALNGRFQTSSEGASKHNWCA